MKPAKIAKDKVFQWSRRNASLAEDEQSIWLCKQRLRLAAEGEIPEPGSRRFSGSRRKIQRAAWVAELLHSRCNLKGIAYVEFI